MNKKPDFHMTSAEIQSFTDALCKLFDSKGLQPFLACCFLENIYIPAVAESLGLTTQELRTHIKESSVLTESEDMKNIFQAPEEVQ